MLRQLAHLRNRTQTILQTQANLTRNSSRTMSQYIVDAWAQPLSPKFAEGLPEVARLLVQSRSPAAQLMEQGIGPRETLDMMENSGVTKTLLSAWHRPGKSIISNEDILQYTQAYPDRFVGIGTVDLSNPVKAVAEVEKCIKEYGFKGIRILPWLWNKPPTTNLYYPIYAKCVELDVPFCTQVGHTGPLCPSEPGRPVPYIDQVALDFPDLKILGGHIGYPWTDEMIGVAWKHPNVYIDTSAHNPQYYPPQLIQFMNSYGANKVLFGTNFPQLTWDTCVKQALELPLRDKVMQKFLWQNADRVFKLGMGGTTDSAKAKL